VQKTVTGFVSDGRANPSAGWDRVLFLQGPGHQDCLDSARRIEDRAAEIPRAKIFVDQGGFELLLDKTLDPYGRWIARQERLRLQSLQTNLVISPRSSKYNWKRYRPEGVGILRMLSFPRRLGQSSD
jgi:hypothetical protein